MPASLDSSRPVRIRWQPWAARAWAMARPMPRVAPVMRATWPRSGRDFEILLALRWVKMTAAFWIDRDILPQGGDQPPNTVAKNARTRGRPAHVTSLLYAVGALADQGQEF